jgi:hypothetical protein
LQAKVVPVTPQVFPFLHVLPGLNGSPQLAQMPLTQTSLSRGQKPMFPNGQPQCSNTPPHVLVPSSFAQ